MGIEKRVKEKDKSGDELMSKEEATRYRGTAARTNYLSQDRPDLAFSAKEACRRMSSAILRAFIFAAFLTLNTKAPFLG